MMRNEHLAQCLQVLQAALDHEGILALVLKGPWLAFKAYPESGCREIGDVDLCIKEKDYLGATEVLRTLGYQYAGSLPKTAEEALNQAHYGEQLRFHANGKRMIELHFRMINVGPPGLMERWLWDNHSTLELSTGSPERAVVHVPDFETMLVHLLLHANQHGFTVLRLLHDIRYALEVIGERLDEDKLIRILRSLQLAPSAYFGLQLAAELAGAEVPSTLTRELRPHRLRRALFSHLWQVPRARRLEVPRRPTETEAARLYLLEMGSILDKGKYMAGVVGEAGGVVPFFKKVQRIKMG